MFKFILNIIKKTLTHKKFSWQEAFYLVGQANVPLVFAAAASAWEILGFKTLFSIFWHSSLQAILGMNDRLVVIVQAPKALEQSLC